MSEDWRVTLDLMDPNQPTYWLELCGDEQEALAALTAIAYTIVSTGAIPITGEIRHPIPAAILRRHGRRTYMIRCDAAEREGHQTGVAYLRVQEYIR